MAFPSLVGVELNSLAVWLPPQTCQRFRLGLLAAGSRLNRSILGGSIRGPHIQDPEAFLLRARPVLRLYEHAAALRHRKESGLSVRMRKPASKHGRPNKLPVQLCLGIRSTNPHTPIAMVSSI